MLKQSNIVECQNKFNLSYHVQYAYICQNLIGFQNKNVLEVGGSLPEQFVFDYLECSSWSAVETPEYEEALSEVGGLSHQGTTLYNDNYTFQRGFQEYLPSNYTLYLDNIENLPSEFYEKYDLIFSIAAFEHIHKFPQALEKMFFALKPGGQLFSMFSPIWSSHNGHHLPKILDGEGNHFNFNKSPIPPWGHLLMRPPELTRFLYQKIDKETADSIVYYVYNSPHINRFFTEDYIDFFKQSLFTIQKFDLTFSKKLNRDTQLKLEKLHPKRKNFQNNGILVVLQKDESKQSLSLHNSIEYRLAWQLSNELKLRDINFIIFPDWLQDEEVIGTELSQTIQILIENPRKSQITLIVDTSCIDEENANFLLSGIAMNLLMEKNLNVENGPEISFLGKLYERQKQALSHLLTARISLQNENQQAIASVGAENLPTLDLASLENKRIVKKEDGSWKFE